MNDANNKKRFLERPSFYGSPLTKPVSAEDKRLRTRQLWLMVGYVVLGALWLAESYVDALPFRYSLLLQAVTFTVLFLAIRVTFLRQRIRQELVRSTTARESPEQP